MRMSWSRTHSAHYVSIKRRRKIIQCMFLDRDASAERKGCAQKENKSTLPFHFLAEEGARDVFDEEITIKVEVGERESFEIRTEI